MKLQYQEKASELDSQLENERNKLKEKDDLIAEADLILQEFNNEKHEVKAKFKHLMQMLAIKASQESQEETISVRDESLHASQPSSYKGRDGEVDLNHCFEEMEQIVIEFKDKQESRIVELISDKEQLTGTIHE